MKRKGSRRRAMRRRARSATAGAVEAACMDELEGIGGRRPICNQLICNLQIPPGMRTRFEITNHKLPNYKLLRLSGKYTVHLFLRANCSKSGVGLMAKECRASCSISASQRVLPKA